MTSRKDNDTRFWKFIGSFRWPSVELSEDVGRYANAKLLGHPLSEKCKFDVTVPRRYLGTPVSKPQEVTYAPGPVAESRDVTPKSFPFTSKVPKVPLSNYLQSFNGPVSQFPKSAFLFRVNSRRSFRSTSVLLYQNL